MEESIVRYTLRLWREALAVFMPLVLILPMLVLTSAWISWVLPKFSINPLLRGSEVGGTVFIHVVFSLPSFGLGIAAGCILGFLAGVRVLRLALLFGISHYAIQSFGVIRTGSSLLLLVPNLLHIGLPLFAAWVVFGKHANLTPGGCSTCGYDLTGNVSGVCPECGVKT